MVVSVKNPFGETVVALYKKRIVNKWPYGLMRLQDYNMTSVVWKGDQRHDESSGATRTSSRLSCQTMIVLSGRFERRRKEIREEGGS